MEGLLNYAYYQTGAINQFDQYGHLLHFSLYDFHTGPCGNFLSGRDEKTGAHVVPKNSDSPGEPTLNVGGRSPTSVFLDRRLAACVAWLGPNQPGVTSGPNLPKYDPSVCPHGTAPAAARRELCSSGHPKAKSASASQGGAAPSGAGASQASGPNAGQVPGAPSLKLPPVQVPKPGVPGNPTNPNNLKDLLHLGGHKGGGGGGGSVGGKVKKLRHHARHATKSKHAARDLLGFIFSP